jgi:ligand-binding sensor domain-containing protein
VEVNVNLDAKGVAIVVVVTAAVVAGAYTLGMKQAKQEAPVATVPPQQLTTAPTQGAMPSNHPAMPMNLGDQQTGAGFTHFRVGNRNVKGMVADGGLVWVGTSGGVVRYDVAKDDYKVFDVSSGSLISNGVFHLSKLDNDHLAVGTYGGGMSILTLSSNQWKNYNIPNGLADQFVYDVVKADNGDLWIATWSGVNLVRGGKLDDDKAWQTFTVENTKGGLPNDWVYGAERGKNGEMWFATEGGLARYKDGKWQNWGHDQGLGAKYEVVKDDVAYAQDPAKMSQHHAQQKSEQGLSNIQVGFNPNYIVSLAVDKDGSVWCGTWGGGLSHFDGKTWKTYTVKDGLPGNHIFMLKLDDGDGKLWIGTNRGLARFKPDGKGFNIMTRADGLFADNVFSMTRASDGALWVGSFGGVARLTNVKL